MKKLSITDIYPIIFSVYPILALSSNNLIYVELSSLVRSVLITFLLAILIMVLSTLLTRDLDKGGLLTLIVLFTFFSYGHVYQFLFNAIGGSFRHRYLIIIFMGLILILGTLVLRAKRIPINLKRYLLYFSIALVFIAGFPTFRSAATKLFSSGNIGKQAVTSDHMNSDQPKPDIYWIILDSYTRADVLKREYKFDNSEFLSKLRGMGFYVADCSQSNYPSTRYSLSSAIQANYLKEVNPDGTLLPFSQSLVISTLRSYGYSVYAFENRSKGHLDLGEDKLLSRTNPVSGKISLQGGLSEFESELIRTSLIRLFVDMPQLLPFLDFTQAEFQEHFLQVKYTLNELPEMPSIPGPKFVMVHILVPHEPYIFSPEGEYKYTSLKDKNGYTSNIKFLNSQLPDLLQQLIDLSSIPPVIIIQGDHGPNLQSGNPVIRHSILNTYFANEEAKGQLYPTISPVNSFRVILNAYFDMSLDLLEDKAYFAWGPKQMTEENITPDMCSP